MLGCSSDEFGGGGGVSLGAPGATRSMGWLMGAWVLGSLGCGRVCVCIYMCGAQQISKVN